MLRRLVLYPFLFILYLILNPLLSNLDEIGPSQALRSLITLNLVAFAGVLTLSFITKNWHYAGYIVFLVFAFIFVFEHLNRVLQSWFPYNEDWFQWVLLATWGIILLALGFRRIWLRFGGARRVTPFLNLVFSIAIVSQFTLTLLGLFPGSSSLPRQVSLPPTGAFERANCSNRPDIYFIVMDGYARADVLEALYGVDNARFLTSLKRKGFYVADHSRANYIQTIYSIPSALNFTYLQPKPENVRGYKYFPQLVADSEAMSFLRHCGYQMVTFETGFFFTNYPEAELYLAVGNPLNEFESHLLSGTPLHILLDELDLERPKAGYQGHRQRVLFTFDKLMEVPDIPGPKFVYAHVLSPHPPFVFDANGQPIEPAWSYSIGDGNHYRGSWEDYRTGYAGQVQFVNRMLEKAVRAILTRSRRPPVIIIQGDHGPGGFLNWNSPDKTCLWERTAILNAYYFPNGGEKYLYPTISPVNSFRVVLNTYFGTNLKLLPDETYFTSHLIEGEFINITGKRGSLDNCREVNAWSHGNRTLIR